MNQHTLSVLNQELARLHEMLRRGRGRDDHWAKLQIQILTDSILAKPKEPAPGSPEEET